MEVYFDISDLMNWKINHLTGIQRTVVGLLNGFVENNVDIILIAYDNDSNGFHIVSPTEISSKVHKYFTQKTRYIIIERYQRSTHPNDHSSSGKIFFSESQNVHQNKGNSNMFLFKRLLIGIFIKLPLKKTIIDLIIFMRKIMGFLKKQKKIIQFSAIDIIVSPGVNWSLENRNKKLFEFKKKGTRIYVIIYDIIPIKKPDWVIDSRTFKRETIKWIKNANQIFTISIYSKKDIINFCEKNDITIPDIRVIRLADSFNENFKIQDLPMSVFTNEIFFICVSSVTLHKNQQLVIEAWKIIFRKFKFSTPKLIFIGSVDDSMKSLKENIERDPELNKIIYFNQNIDDSELEWYYHNCRATIFPSFYEGWGLPVGESLARGKICLASNATSIPEVGGELVEYFDPYDPAQLSILIEKATFDIDWVMSRESKVNSEYNPTDWKTTAFQFLSQIKH